jgi:hypothetical protein
MYACMYALKPLYGSFRESRAIEKSLQKGHRRGSDAIALTPTMTTNEASSGSDWHCAAKPQRNRAHVTSLPQPEKGALGSSSGVALSERN